MVYTEQSGYSLEKLRDLLSANHLAFADEHKKLLTAQVVLTDRVDKLAVGIQELREFQKHSDERLNAIIAVVDDLIRNRPSL